MRKSLLLLIGSVFISFICFSQQDISKLKGPRPVIDLATIPENAYRKGIIDIKFDSSVEALLKLYPSTSADGFITFGIPAVDSLNKQYNVTQAKLLFGSLLTSSTNSDKTLLDAGIKQFSDKHKQWGFQLWYQLVFPSTVNIKEIVAKFQQLYGIIDVAEPKYVAALISDKVDSKTTSPTEIPNDPLFKQQWNYNNTGQASGTPGSDIHLPQAWDIETGKPNVIVAIDDGGIQLNHPDLAANIWSGKGFNFVTNSTHIDSSEHATHTSGTVAAVSNNGIGVSGIAGGDGTPGSGIRLMSLEIFGNDSLEALSFGAPFIWAADSGAAISQNSWGYSTAGVYDQDVLDGIDYFIANGGGTVLKGGLVCFSAGNSSTNAPFYPAYYSKTIAVAATNNKDVLSYYSNYGTWVDICAPGGEQSYDGDPGGVLSTTFGSTYEFLQGTSMACPHVSGVAALIVSHIPGVLTADSLRNILLNQVDNIYPINSPIYAGQLGTGRLDAFKCLQIAAQIASIVNLHAKVSQFDLPMVGVNVCDTILSATIQIVNLGKDTLRSIEIEEILDSTPVASVYNWTGSLPINNYATVTLYPTIALSPGTHTLQVFTIDPNGTADEIPGNDTVSITFTVQQGITLPAFQNFEPDSAPMPPPGGWGIINPDNDTTWDKIDSVIGPNGDTTSCMWMNGSHYNSSASIDIFNSPKINITGIDTIKFSFDLSYGQWSSSFVDTLAVVYSPDCGATWLPTGYKKYGPSLSTIGDVSLDSSYFPDSSSQWRHDEIDIPTCGIGSSNILIGLEWINGFGNNCFIDNINITKVNSYQNNAALVAINLPSGITCTTTVTPQVTIANYGTDTLTSLNINYQVDNGTVNTFNWTGNLSKCSTSPVTLNSINAAYGDHIFKVYTSDPNGQQDQFPLNDTSSEQLDISPLVNLPATQGFESDSFPSTNWSVLNPDGLITWKRSTNAAYTGNASMVINNYNYTEGNTEDLFFSPVISNNASIDSIFVSFDLSYSPGASYPGSTALPLDTLEIDVSTDCGATLQPVWKKWGADLQTINDPNFAVTSAYTPFNASQWKNINIYLTPFINSSNFQVFFVAKSNHQNNIWIDNINIYPKTVPSLEKKQGYLVFPDPFSNTLKIFHSQPPTTLQEIQVYNSIGQMVSDNQYNGGATTETDIDLTNVSNGIYFVKLIYTDKTIIQKVEKN